MLSFGAPQPQPPLAMLFSAIIVAVFFTATETAPRRRQRVRKKKQNLHPLLRRLHDLDADAPRPCKLCAMPPLPDLSKPAYFVRPPMTASSPGESRGAGGRSHAPSVPWPWCCRGSRPVGARIKARKAEVERSGRTRWQHCRVEEVQAGSSQFL